MINKSLVENSFNKVKVKRDEETGKVLIDVAKFIENSRNLSAGVLFNTFNEELNKTQPEKSKLSELYSHQ
jgi:hypothetical protein